MIEELQKKYKSKLNLIVTFILDSYTKCDKPFKKRYPKNDPNKPVSRKPIAAPKKTGIEKLKERKLKAKK